MAEYTTETVTSTVRRWIIPAAEPWGAAAAAYRKQHGLPEDTRLHGDALRFHVRDDEIVIQFSTEEAS
ncbi:hypothetical protein [Streptomyces sp. NPDC095613]|uniref:hypothetical protein n=1 Tax=Streptomyces sp. NPDC095613 TaxID=3155540 RepID=UPI00332B8B1B